MVIHDFNEDELEEGGALNLPTAHLGDLQSIHPIFQRGNIRCTDDEYEALKPSLRLASAYLSESGLQVFWQTILFGARQQIPNTPGWSQLFRPNPPFRTEHYQAFGELLVQMRSVFGFRFGQCTQQYGTDPWGMAQGWDRAAAGRGWQPPPGITGLCSVITLHGDSLESAMSSYNLLRSATGPLSSETTSLILRQQFFLANTTMHELAHAMNNAQKGDRHEREPFVGDQRRAELGYAWEAFVHGGRTAQIHETRSCDCGLYFGSWPPGAEINEMIGPGPATGYGYNRWASRRVWNTDYIVPMSHIQKLHTRHFWEVELRRFGMSELKIPKTLGLRWGNSSRVARFGAGVGNAGSVSGGSSRDYSADEEGRVRRRP